ncbi:phage tail assembly chaperone [Bradyrhizobium sp. LA2.1]|uniref:phage tail assembly chaperone n=1 Tax=Bradyrhizobium sp. LA2.1 TaxID=3156376 RepID=UPI0033932062
MNIHYNVTTGQIMSYGHGADHGDGFEDSHFPGCKVAIIPDQPIDARTQRFDVATWKVVDKETPDPDPFQMFEVRGAVHRELSDTDKYVLPDFPISETERAAWVVYRKALRDASKGRNSAADVVAAIPKRPDGTDAVEWLRAKLNSENPS